MTALANTLNERGIKTGQGSHWHPQTAKRVLEAGDRRAARGTTDQPHRPIRWAGEVKTLCEQEIICCEAHDARDCQGIIRIKVNDGI